MKKVLAVILVSIPLLFSGLAGCESTKGADKRILKDLKKSSKKVEKGITKFGEKVRGEKDKE